MEIKQQLNLSGPSGGYYLKFDAGTFVDGGGTGNDAATPTTSQSEIHVMSRASQMQRGPLKFIHNFT